MHLLNDDIAIQKLDKSSHVISTEDRDFYIQTSQFRVRVNILDVDTAKLDFFEEGYFKKVDFSFEVYRDIAVSNSA